MKAVLTVVGKDAVGILAKVSTECAKYNVNILDVSQSILQDMFCMIMLIPICTDLWEQFFSAVPEAEIEVMDITNYLNNSGVLCWIKALL